MLFLFCTRIYEKSSDFTWLVSKKKVINYLIASCPHLEISSKPLLRWLRSRKSYVTNAKQQLFYTKIKLYFYSFNNHLIILHYRTKFTITHESVDNRQWNYTVEYEEHLSQLPFVTNKIVGEFVVDKTQSEHVIRSVHRTCFAGIYCRKYLPRRCSC